MKRRPAITRKAVRTALLSVLALLLLTPAALSGVTVALLPSTQTVAPGAEFDLYLTVTQSGSAFNAFDAVVGHNPAALVLVPLSPLTLQEGSLMKTACSNTFHQFRQGAGVDTITDVLLCNGISVTGPGQIYRLHFQASTTPQVTTVQLLPGLYFYSAGVYVNPVTSSNATVTIGGSVDVGDPSRAQGLRLRAAPNPARAGATITFETNRADRQELQVLDALGRVVRHLESDFFEPGIRSIFWDGCSDAGKRLPAGVYCVRTTSQTASAQARIVLLD